MVHVQVPENQIPARKWMLMSFVCNIQLQVVTCGRASWNKETLFTSTSAWVVAWFLQQKIEKRPGLTGVEEVSKYIHFSTITILHPLTTIVWKHQNCTYPPVPIPCRYLSHHSPPSPPWDLHKYPLSAVQSLWLLRLGNGKKSTSWCGFIHVRLALGCFWNSCK